MSDPKGANPVKLFVSILFTDKKILAEVLEKLRGHYGSIDFISPAKPFLYTNYYCREMGSPLERFFVSFATLIPPESLPDIKLWTNDLEKAFVEGSGRRVNLDPGYISGGNLILITGKEFAHRPYLRDGLYADLTLIYSKQCFQPLPWTYPDYREKEIREMFARLRAKYILQLRMTDAHA